MSMKAEPYINEYLKIILWNNQFNKRKTFLIFNKYINININLFIFIIMSIKILLIILLTYSIRSFIDSLYDKHFEFMKDCINQSTYLLKKKLD